MAFRCKLTHHPAAAADFQCAKDYFAEIDGDLAGLFQTDFRAALRALATGRLASHLYATGHAIRWVKLARFSHKIFFEQKAKTSASFWPWSVDEDILLEFGSC